MQQHLRPRDDVMGDGSTSTGSALPSPMSYTACVCGTSQHIPTLPVVHRIYTCFVHELY